jgi:hypothetical protein
MQVHLRNWNNQLKILRRLLEKDKNYQKALPVFLRQHAMVHSARLRADARWSFQDEVLRGLADAQIRYTPQGRVHSVVWMLWHITRIEDVTMNLLLADSPQVLHRGKWMTKLRVATENVGNEMSAAESVALSEAINLKALLAYRLAVGKRTREIVRRMRPERLVELPRPERLQRIFDEGAVGEKGLWLLKYWGGHPSYNLLLMPATRHCFVHFNEISRMLPKLKRLQAS